MDRAAVALFCDVNDKTIIDWINRFNMFGIDGLIDKERRGAPRRISNQEMSEHVIPLLEDPSKANQTHWTATKLHGYLDAVIESEFSYSTLLRNLHKYGYCLKLPRRTPEPSNSESWTQQREDFKQKLIGWLNDDSVQLWFSDETGVEADPRPRKRWVEKGSKPRVPYGGTHLRSNVIGAVSPSTGELSAILFNHCDTDVFQAFLDNMSKEYPRREGIRQLIILDNASWHKAKRLNWHHFEPEYLPPYSPDFNPIERLWLVMKQNHFADFYTKDSEALEQRIIEALNSLFDSPGTVAKTCAISGNF